jgi:hypothetical protein
VSQRRSPPPHHDKKELSMMGMIVLMMVQWGALTAWLARSKRRNLAAWFAVGAVLPVIGVGLALAVPVKQPRRPRKRASATPVALPAHRPLAA